MLRVNTITTRYGAVQALRSVSLAVAEGQMVALIGPNGAGKTTLLNTISGFLAPSAGTVELNNIPVTGRSPHEVARLGLLHVPEGRWILGPLSVEENLELGRLAIGKRGAAMVDDLERVFSMFPVLKQRRKQVSGSLSGGEQQMLAIGRALMGQPRLLMLDEPSLGLAPVIVNQVFEALTRLNREGLTTLLVEQSTLR